MQKEENKIYSKSQPPEIIMIGMLYSLPTFELFPSFYFCKQYCNRHPCIKFVTHS